MAPDDPVNGAAADGDSLEAEARSLHRQGDLAAAVVVLERAFAAYRAEARPRDAARLARIRAYQCALDGDGALVSGWLARARRLVDDEQAVEGRWLELFDAMADADSDRQRRRLRAIADDARRLGAADLECDALGVLGGIYVGAGEVAAGMALLDEAMTAVCAGEVSEPVVIEGACCLLLGACEATQDIARAEQWLDRLEPLIGDTGQVSLRPVCRSYHGGILTAAGRYAESERTLTAALQQLTRGYAFARRNALVRLADLRLRQGRYEEAEQLLEGIEEEPDAALPLATLHLVRGRPALAVERIGRAIPLAAGVTRARLHALLTVCHIVLGDPAAAASEGAAPLRAAVTTGGPVVAALADQAEARVAAAAGQTAEAGRLLRLAIAGFDRVRMPLELATARIELAELLHAGEPEVAVAEATRALAGARDIGAARLLDRAAAVLRDLGAPSRSGWRSAAPLTHREQEVLDLLGHGLTNPEIAERLVISRKTVEHHVSRVLTKLGVRNRAEAAAWAARGSERR